MMETIINGLLTFIMNLVEILLYPIDLVISKFIPGLDTLISYITSFFNYIGNLIPFAVSYLGLSQEILSLVVAYFIFKITVPLFVSTVKLAIKWYKALKF